MRNVVDSVAIAKTAVTEGITSLIENADDQRQNDTVDEVEVVPGYHLFVNGYRLVSLSTITMILAVSYVRSTGVRLYPWDFITA